MATHSSILAWRIPWTEGVWRAMIHGVTKGQRQLKRHSTQQSRMTDVMSQGSENGRPTEAARGNLHNLNRRCAESQSKS